MSLRPILKASQAQSTYEDAGGQGIRFLLISGRAIQEPVAWHGPIVMNTPEELAKAFSELQNGTIVRPVH